MKMFGAIITFLAAVAFSLVLLVLIGYPLQNGSLLRTVETMETKPLAVMSAGAGIFFFGVVLFLRRLWQMATRLFWQAAEENYVRHLAHMRSIEESRVRSH